MSASALQLSYESRIRNAFALFDKDGSGALSVEELRSVLTRPGSGGPTLTDADVASIIADFDTNGDGEISLEEFAPLWEAVIGGDAQLAADAPPPDEKQEKQGIAKLRKDRLQKLVADKSILDAHCHYFNYMQETEGIDALGKAMDANGVGYACLTGNPFKKTWVGVTPKDLETPPVHHLYDDGDLVSTHTPTRSHRLSTRKPPPQPPPPLHHRPHSVLKRAAAGRRAFLLRSHGPHGSVRTCRATLPFAPHAASIVHSARPQPTPAFWASTCPHTSPSVLLLRHRRQHVPPPRRRKEEERAGRHLKVHNDGMWHEPRRLLLW